MAGRKLTPEIRHEINTTIEGGVTPAEQAQLKELLKNIDPEELEKLEVSVKAELDKFMVETKKEATESLGPMEYGIDGIRNDSEVFELFLENKPIKIFFQQRIKEKLSELEVPDGINTTTIEVTVWNTIVKNIGFASGSKYLGGLVSEFISGKVSDFGSAIKGGSEKALEAGEGDLDLDKIGNIIDQLQELGKSFEDGAADAEKVEKLGGLTDSLFGYVDSILANYYTNLSTLTKLGKDQGFIDESGNIVDNNFKALFDNPLIIDELLTKGKVSQGSTVIDLKSGNMTLGAQNPDDIKGAQDEFMRIVSTNTSSEGKKIDNLRKKAKSFATVLGKLGFDSDSLNDLKKTLEGFLPPIGAFLASILSFFLKGGIESELDKFTAEKKIKVSLKNLDAYVKNDSNTGKLPFTLNEDESLTKEENTITKDFLKKIRDHEDSLKKEDETKTSTIIDDDTFWNGLFTKNPDSDGVSPTMKRVLQSIAPLKSGTTKPTQKEFFEKLKKINLSKPVEKTLPIKKGELDGGSDGGVKKAEIVKDGTGDDAKTKLAAAIAAGGTAAAVNKSGEGNADKRNEDTGKTKVPEKEIPVKTIAEQVLGATSFPIKLADGRSVEHNPDTYEIEFGKEKFKIIKFGKTEVTKTMLNFISPILEISNGDVIIKNKNIGTELGKIPLNDFATLLQDFDTSGKGSFIHKNEGENVVEILFGKA